MKKDKLRFLEWTGKNASIVGATLLNVGDFSFISSVMNELQIRGKNPLKVISGMVLLWDVCCVRGSVVTVHGT